MQSEIEVIKASVVPIKDVQIMRWEGNIQRFRSNIDELETHLLVESTLKNYDT